MSKLPGTINDILESLRLHIRSLQRAGLRFDAVSSSRGHAQKSSCPDTLDSLRRQSTDCERCRLCNDRTHVVFGEGSSEARLMFVGDAPDHESDLQGRAFAGESGQLLTRIIEAIKLRRDQVYLTTVVKCRVTQGEPGDEAIEACAPYLQRQIELIRPAIICALGPTATRILHGDGTGDTPRRGKMFRRGDTLIMPTHHPELMLRKPELKGETWVDVQVIQRELESGPNRRH